MNWTSREEFANQQGKKVGTISGWVSKAKLIKGEEWVKERTTTFLKKHYYNDELCDVLKDIGEGLLILKGDQRRTQFGNCNSQQISQNTINKVIPEIDSEIDCNRFQISQIEQPSQLARNIVQGLEIGHLTLKAIDSPEAADEFSKVIRTLALQRQQNKQLEARNKQLEYENKQKDTEIHIDTVQINNWINKGNRKSFLNMPDNM